MESHMSKKCSRTFGKVKLISSGAQQNILIDVVFGLGINSDWTFRVQMHFLNRPIFLSFRSSSARNMSASDC